MRSEPIAIRRDVVAIQIPAGTPMHLHAGTEVRITQALGDTYTVTTESGYMVRINQADADALGLDITVAPKLDEAEAAKLTTEEVEKLIWAQLRTCYDPEIPVNIVELGLVYDCRVTPLETGGNRVDAKITLTAPGCGMGPVLQSDAKAKILTVPTVKECLIDVVWEPQWDQSMMSEAARLQLGM